MKLIFSSLLLLFATICDGQVSIKNLSLTDSSKNIFYIGVDNRILLIGPNDSHSLSISGGGGSILKNGTKEYIVRVNAITEDCQLTLLKGTKIIQKRTYSVRTINEAIATTSGVRDTTLRVKQLLTNPFMVVSIPGCYFRLDYRVTSFMATFVQSSDSISRSAPGNIFSDEQVRIIKTLVPGDRIWFSSIRCLGPDSRALALSPFWIRIE